MNKLTSDQQNPRAFCSYTNNPALAPESCQAPLHWKTAAAD
jgi:hypothetical protein